MLVTKGDKTVITNQTTYDAVYKAKGYKVAKADHAKPAIEAREKKLDGGGKREAAAGHGEVRATAQKERASA